MLDAGKTLPAKAQVGRGIGGGEREGNRGGGPGKSGREAGERRACSPPGRDLARPATPHCRCRPACQAPQVRGSLQARAATGTVEPWSALDAWGTWEGGSRMQCQAAQPFLRRTHGSMPAGRLFARTMHGAQALHVPHRAKDPRWVWLAHLPCSGHMSRRMSRTKPQNNWVAPQRRGWLLDL